MYASPVIYASQGILQVFFQGSFSQFWSFQAGCSKSSSSSLLYNLTYYLLYNLAYYLLYNLAYYLLYNLAYYLLYNLAYYLLYSSTSSIIALLVLLQLYQFYYSSTSSIIAYTTFYSLSSVIGQGQQLQSVCIRGVYKTLRD